MQRVTTQLRRGRFTFRLEDGTKVSHASSFDFGGRAYYFFGNVFYDLEDDLVNHIFGR